VLAVLAPVAFDVYFGLLLACVTDAAYEHGLLLSIASTQHEHARELELLEQLSTSTDGAILILPEASAAELERAVPDAYPLAVVDPRLPLNDRIPSVTSTNRRGAYTAIEHLLGLGHERIAPGVAAAAQLLDLADPPTAIFCANDPLACGTLRAARERGLHVPENLSIVGFDDFPLAGGANPPLTTIRQPAAEMGRAGVGLIVRQLTSREIRGPQLELPTRLIVRESTAPPLSGA
jgi:LacI family transcriptional regulator